MKFSLIPADTEDTASSRIRVYSLQKALRSLGHTATVGPAPDAEVCLVQKRAPWETLREARQAKARGCIILYDVDDLGKALWYHVSHRLFFEMIRLADAVTTDTEAHRDQLVRKYGVKRVEVIPDTIDYYPSGPVRPSMREGKPLRVLWFGAAPNIGLFEKYISSLTAMPDIEVVVAIDLGAIPAYSAKYPCITFVPWSRDSFLSTLQSCDLSCLMHDGSAVDQAKSNNKMIASITWGVPAVVSRTPEYERTAREAGVEPAVFSDELELRAAIEHLRPREARIAYLDRAQPDIWDRYAPRAIATKFVEMAARLCVAKTLKAVPSRERSFGGTNHRLTDRLKSRLDFEFWRFRVTEDRIGKVNSLIHKAVRRAYHAVTRRQAMSAGVSALPTSMGLERDCVRDWVNPPSAGGRMRAYECRRERGMSPLIHDPTVDELRSVLEVHDPRSVLEVGCGCGELLEKLAEQFNVEGCDASHDLLNLCSPQLKVFHLDITSDNCVFLRKNAGRWDVVFTRGVMLDCMESPAQMAYAMNNMLMLASKKIIIWADPKFCERMQRFSNSTKFEYHPTEHRS
jgi:2-polyprenyl-3-methyl-5-hydroxy-6-metoxy-1,4-benzoquinol methylase